MLSNTNVPNQTTSGDATKTQQIFLRQFLTFSLLYINELRGEVSWFRLNHKKIYQHKMGGGGGEGVNSRKGLNFSLIPECSKQNPSVRVMSEMNRLHA